MTLPSLRGSTSSPASSARDHDLIQRRLTSSSCPHCLCSTYQDSIRRGCTPGELLPTKTNTYDFNSCWNSSGRSPFRFTCNVTFEQAFMYYIENILINLILCRKKQNFVNFDLQGVDMSRFALDGFDNKFSKFNLYAVSVTFLRSF